MNVGDVSGRWAKTKKLYEQTTGKKKPSETILKVFRKSTGIENSLKDYEVLSENFDNEKKKLSIEKQYDQLTKASAEADGHIKTYLKQLDNAIKADKEADKAYSLGLQILKADLETINSLIAVDVKNRKLTMKSKLLQDDAIAANEAVFKHLQKQFLPQLVAGIRHLHATLLKVKARPTVDAYNASIRAAVREMIVDILPANFKDDQRDALNAGVKYPRAEIMALEQFNVGDLKTVDDAKDVLPNLHIIEVNLAGIVRWIKSIPGAKLS